MRSQTRSGNENTFGFAATTGAGAASRHLRRTSGPTSLLAGR